MASAADFNIALSDSAAKRVAFLIEHEAGPNSFMRISVEGGGCSGFQYNFLFDDALTADDIPIENNGVKVVVDEISAEYMKNSVIDYVDEMIGARFEIKNPNAASSCGCGTSFSLV